ncbi:MAG: hypothetical protein AAGA83_05170 [Cyanobacteria bacterium P01_F01_bin.116]
MTLASVLGYLKRHFGKLAKSLLLIVILLFVSSCSGSPQADNPTLNEPPSKSLFAPRPKIKQVDPPKLIQELHPWLDQYVPQVQIRQPEADQILDITTVNVVLQIQDLPIYKDETWEMGPHVELLLDNQPYSSLYDLDQPISLENLTPGTHTLRVWAERPWHESFKNKGAYDQVTFHIFAKTDENSPATGQPLLTYGTPMGTYGAEPVLLDFYLTDAPLHQVAQENPNLKDWQIRYTINGDSFTIQDWRPIYIEGLKSGKNWIQLTLVDDQGNPIEGLFNNTVRLIDYDPALNDSLAQIVRGDLTLEQVGHIIDPTYSPPVPEIPEVLEQSEYLSQDEDAGVTEVSEPPESQRSVEADTPKESTAEEPTVAIPDGQTEDLESKTSEREPSEITEPSDETNDLSPITKPSNKTKDLSTQKGQDNNLNSSLTDETADSFDAADSLEPDAERDIAPLSDETTNTTAELERMDSLSVTGTPEKSSQAEEPTAESAPDIELEPPSAPLSSDTSEDTASQTSPKPTSASTRRYLQRLYDYSDRANRDRT